MPNQNDTRLRRKAKRKAKLAAIEQAKFEKAKAEAIAELKITIRRKNMELLSYRFFLEKNSVILTDFQFLRIFNSNIYNMLPAVLNLINQTALHLSLSANDIYISAEDHHNFIREQLVETLVASKIDTMYVRELLLEKSKEFDPKFVKYFEDYELQPVRLNAQIARFIVNLVVSTKYIQTLLNLPNPMVRIFPSDYPSLSSYVFRAHQLDDKLKIHGHNAMLMGYFNLTPPVPLYKRVLNMAYAGLRFFSSSATSNEPACENQPSENTAPAPTI